MTPQRQMGFDKIAERLSQYSEVKSVYLMSGAYDFTVILEEKTMRGVASSYLRSWRPSIPSSARLPTLY